MMKEIYEEITMKKLFTSLPFRLMAGVVIGILAGWLAGMESAGRAGTAVMNVVVSVRFILAELINFCVPLIIIGFIAPSITRLGHSASRMLGIALLCAYASTILAAFFSMAAGYGIIPLLSVPSETEGARELPEIVFQLEIPAVMSVMSALVLSVLLGLACTWTKAAAMTALLEELRKIVLEIVTRVVIPVLPVFIGFTFCALSYEGAATKQLPVFIQVILIVILGHYLWLAVLYTAAGVYSKSNPLKVLKNYGPAYLTAVGTMSSAATLSVALRCAKKSEPPLRDDMVDFGIPLFANIHLCGSVLTEVFFVMTVSRILYGSLPGMETMILFCVLLGVFAIGAPGVPGGTVMASLGLITGVLGFDETGTALMLTIFALQDSFGTACNITGDGALTLILSGYAEKHGDE